MVKARDVAYKVLTRVDKDDAFAAAALAAEAKVLKEPRDVALAGELVLGVLRRRPWLDKLIKERSKQKKPKIDPRIRRIMHLAVYQIVFLDRVPHRAAVSEAVRQAERFVGGYASGFVNAVLRNIAGGPPESLEPPRALEGLSAAEAACALCLPEWLYTRFAAHYGGDYVARLAQKFNASSPRTLRVDTHRVDLAELSERHPDGLEAGLYSPMAVHARSRKLTADLEDQGLAVLQDEGSQLVALAVEPQAGETILDSCAGRGGKTGAMAVLSGGKAILTAADRAPAKLDRLEFELMRQGFEASTRVLDFTSLDEDFAQSFDKILVDAPCSGSGTLGRRPEIRWRLDPEGVDGLVQIQRAMLITAAKLVRPGGRLVFSTCSLLPEEGELQVAPFLEQHPNFRLVDTPPKGWPGELPWRGGQVLVSPVQCGSDGYFIAVFERLASRSL